eukprot:PhF_6_TR7897/c0_g1_i4/m.11647
MHATAPSTRSSGRTKVVSAPEAAPRPSGQMEGGETRHDLSGKDGGRGGARSHKRTLEKKQKRTRRRQRRRQEKEKEKRKAKEIGQAPEDETTKDMGNRPRQKGKRASTGSRHRCVDVDERDILPCHLQYDETALKSENSPLRSSLTTNPTPQFSPPVPLRKCTPLAAWTWPPVRVFPG